VYLLGWGADFRVGFTEATNHKFMVRSDGNVGIDTMSPGEKLHINPGKLRIDDGNNWLLLGDHASSTAGIAMADGNSPVYLHAWGANFKMAFGSATNHKVDITPSGSATFTGSVRATSFPTTSDARLKEVLNDYDAGVASLSKVQPKVYRYREGNARNHSTTETHVGFIAQELLAAGLAHAVHQSEPDGYYSVDPQPLLATAINAINEQQAMIHEQGTKIDTQQAELEEQRSVLQAQHATIALQDERIAKLESMIMALAGQRVQ